MSIPSTQVVPNPFLYANNAQLSWLSATTLSVAVSQVRNSTNVADIATTTATTINAANNGVNALDTGDLANNTWYAVHEIGDSTFKNQPGFLLSTSATAPYMPFGYDVLRRIGWVLTDGSANILKFAQYGNGNQRTYMWDVLINELNAEGSATYAAVSVASSVPPTSTLAIMNWKFLPNSDGNTGEIRPTGSTSTTNQYVGGSTAAKTSYGQLFINTSAAQSIDYITASANDDLTLDTVGFVDFI